MKKIMPENIINKKEKQEKIIVLTAYDYTFAKILDENEIDIVLVGDSLGNVFSGFKNTLPVTMEDMLYHTKAVANGITRSLLVSDMPFLSYHTCLSEAKKNAGLLIKAGASAVKIEANSSQVETVKAIIEIGIPVIGHIGFTPQQVYQLGGYKIQGKTDEAAEQLISLALNLEKAGCFAVVLEMVPKELAAKVTSALQIPTIGCGAGPYCDGQVLVTHDILGLNQIKKLKFVKTYLNLDQQISQALASFKQEIKEGLFPNDDYSF